MEIKRLEDSPSSKSGEALRVAFCGGRGRARVRGSEIVLIGIYPTRRKIVKGIYPRRREFFSCRPIIYPYRNWIRPRILYYSRTGLASEMEEAMVTSDPNDWMVWMVWSHNHDEWTKRVSAELDHQRGRGPQWYRDLLDDIRDKDDWLTSYNLATPGSVTSKLSQVEAFERGYLGGW